MTLIKLAVTCTFRTRESGKWAEIQPVDCDKDDVYCETGNSEQYPASYGVDGLHYSVRCPEDLLDIFER